MKLLIILFIGILPLDSKSQSWQEFSVPTDNNLKDVYFFDEKHGWIVGENGIILKYLFDSWVPMESHYSNVNLNALFFTDSIHGWIIGDNGVILKYFNDTISAVSSPTNENLSDIYMLDSTKGWIIGQNRTILEYFNNEWVCYSTDNFSSNMRDLNNIQFLDSTFGLILGDYNRILKYENQKWNEFEDPTNGDNYTGLFILDKENVFNYQYRRALEPHRYPFGWFTKNNMVTITTKELGYVNCHYNVEIYITDSLNGWAIGTSNIYKYDGKSFTEFNSGIEGKILNSIWFVNDSTGWIVGDDGYVLDYNPQLSSINNIIYVKTIRTYPNPFKNQLYLTFNHPCTLIEIMDSNGQILKTYNINDNEISISMDLCFLNSGIYLIKVTGKDIEYIQKIIKE